MTENTLKNRLQEDMKQAMRAHDKARLGTIRMALAAIKQVEIDGRKTLDDLAVLAILSKMVKQRQDAHQQFVAAKREELADVETAEIKVLQSYMPKALSETEVDSIIGQSFVELGFDEFGNAKPGIKDMGALMATIKAKVGSRADMGKISATIKAKLTG